jgi:hypothetical protein
MADDEHKATPSITDISRPGKSRPSDSSKAILVTNRPLMRDSMMTDQAEDGLLGAPLLDLAAQDHVTKLPPSRTKKELIPPSQAKAIAIKVTGSADTTEAVKPMTADSIPEATPELPATPEVQPEPATALVKPPAKPVVVDPPETKTEPVPVVAAAAKPGEVKPPETKPPEAKPSDTNSTEDEPVAVIDTKQAAADAVQAAKVAGLINHQVYVLPINALEKRQARHFVIGGIVLIIVLALVWLDLAADAGFIHVSHLPLTHFFRV